MNNLALILAFSVLLPASTLVCGANVSERANNKFNSLHAEKSKSNSSHSLPSNVIVKREILEANEMPYNHLPPTALISKRSATVLNKLMFALRNSLDKSNSPYDNDLGMKESDNFSGDMTRSLIRGNTNSYDQYPTTLVERRGQKDRKIYLRCYFNAVSCFKKRK